MTTRSFDATARRRDQDTATLMLDLMGRAHFWLARSGQRRQLADLDDHLLRDIGLTRRDAAREAAKYFWQA